MPAGFAEESLFPDVQFAISELNRPLLEITPLALWSIPAFHWTYSTFPFRLYLAITTPCHLLREDMTPKMAIISNSLSQPDAAFTTRLPKIELHAHLTGSISRSTLHDIWSFRQTDQTRSGVLQLGDPILALPPLGGTNSTINVATFFPLFDRYIYQLVNTFSAVHMSTLAVLQKFADDGVVYLELRTTPRNVAGEGKDSYVRTVLQAMNHFMRTQDRMHVQLILSIDRRNTLEEAMEVVELAKKYRAVSAEFPLSVSDTLVFPSYYQSYHLQF